MYHNRLRDKRLQNLWAQVLSRLPKEVAEIVLPYLTVMDEPKFPPEVEEICPYSMFKTEGLIVLSIDALDECSDAAIKGFIAHELAHAYRLRTYPSSINEFDDCKIDQIAKGWGFAVEVEVMRQINPLR